MMCGGLSSTFVYPNLIYIANSNKIFHTTMQEMEDQLIFSTHAYHEVIDHAMLVKNAMNTQLLPELSNQIFSKMDGDSIFEILCRYSIIGLSFVDCFLPRRGKFFANFVYVFLRS